MAICEYCGFDSDVDSVRAEGAPCGIDGCPIFTCCMKKWEEHKELCHKED